MIRIALSTVCILLMMATDGSAQFASFEEALVDVGNVGVTVTNAGFVGRAAIRNNPTGPPSFEYPLDSGVEHLFESGLWIGAKRGDGVFTVRTGAQTAGGGYSPGAAGYEFAQLTGISARSTLPERDSFTPGAISHQDFIATFEDTSRVLPGTSILMPDVQGQLGAEITMTSLAWNFPFTEYFVILNFDITNISSAPWDSVYIGMYHDTVVRNVNTTQDTGGNFFNKGGYGFIDSLYASYGFNAGGLEETINTYAAVVFLGSEWVDQRTGQKRFYHPNVAASYEADGYSAPNVNPRWWQFSGGTNELSRPSTDDVKYDRMATPFPNPANFATEAEYQAELEAWQTRLRTDGQSSTGNWIGLTPVGPYPRIGPGETVQITFGLVAALKPEEFQGQSGKQVDTAESIALLANNILWAQRTYTGEDNNYNGILDEGEDVNGDGELSRYLIPEPPSNPRLRVEFENKEADGNPVNSVAVYWDKSAEFSIDPVSGKRDFEGYRIFRSNPGDDRTGDIANQASLIAQFDQPGNRTGFNNGFDAIELPAPVTFEGDTTRYYYKFESESLLSGWQYLFSVTAFDEGDPDAGLPSFESSRTSSSVRIFPGSAPVADGSRSVGVYPNPYRVNAAWDGNTNRTRKLHFYNLPERAQIRVYTLAGEIVADFDHDASNNTGDIRWFDNFSASNRILAGGEHAWDILSENGLNIATGLYLFTVEDTDTGDVQRGKFAIIK